MGDLCGFPLPGFFNRLYGFGFRRMIQVTGCFLCLKIDFHSISGRNASNFHNPQDADRCCPPLAEVGASISRRRWFSLDRGGIDPNSLMIDLRLDANMMELDRG